MTVVSLLVLVALLLGNAFFVAAEFALVSVRADQLEPRAEAGSARAVKTLAALRNVSKMMAAAQLGITLCSLGLGAVGEPAVAHLITPVIWFFNTTANGFVRLFGVTPTDEVAASFDEAEIRSMITQSRKE